MWALCRIDNANVSDLILIITALCNNLEHLRLTRWCVDANYVRWKMSAPQIILSSLPSLCQKLSKLVENWRSSVKNNFAVFFWGGGHSAVCDSAYWWDWKFRPV